MTDRLLEIRNLEIDGESDEVWHEIIKGLDLDLDRGEVLGLIGESGAGKSTLGLAAMNFVRPGCRIRGGTIRFDGQELTEQSETTLRKLRGVRIAYVAQSAAASLIGLTCLCAHISVPWSCPWVDMASSGWPSYL